MEQRNGSGLNDKMPSLLNILMSHKKCYELHNKCAHIHTQIYIHTYVYVHRPYVCEPFHEVQFSNDFKLTVKKEKQIW